MKNLLIGTALATIAATGVAAQELSYGRLIANYGMVSTPGGDADITILGAEVGIQVQEFDFWLNGTQLTLSPDGAPFNVTADVTTIGAGYSFGGEYRVDVSSTDLGLGFGGGGGINIGLDEIGVAYDNGTYFGRLSFADVNQPIPGLDGIYSLNVGYNISEEAKVSLSVHDIDESSGSIDPIYILSGEYDTGRWGVKLDAASTNLLGTDLTLVALGGNYQFNNQWGIRGAYTNIDAGGTDIDAYRLGGTYNINDTYTVYAGLTQADLGGTTIDGFNVGISMDFGSKPDSYQTTADRLLGLVETAGAFDY